MRFEEYTEEQQKQIEVRARKIMYKVRDRCLNKKFKQYKDYGGNGVAICEEWLDISNFARDVVELQGWDYDLFVSSKLELDKDFLKRSNKVYCKEFCCLLTRKENMQYKPSIHRPFYGYNQYTQEIKEHFNASMFAKENNCSVNVAWDVLQGEKHRTGDWYLWYADEKPPMVLRTYAEKDGTVYWEINPQKLSIKLGLSRTSCASALNRSGYTQGWRIF